jgi:hypothetical protein
MLAALEVLFCFVRGEESDVCSYGDMQVYVREEKWTENLARCLNSTSDVRTYEHEGRWLLFEAGIWKNGRAAKLLLDAGVNPNTRYGRVGDEYERDGPLHIAILEEDEGMLAILLEGGANPNLRGTDGMTAVHMALNFGMSISALDLLFGHGGKLDVTDDHGRDALSFAQNPDSNAVKDEAADWVLDKLEEEKKMKARVQAPAKVGGKARER